MYALKRFNVERIVASESERDKLISQGFECIDNEEANNQYQEEDEVQDQEEELGPNMESEPKKKSKKKTEGAN